MRSIAKRLGRRRRRCLAMSPLTAAVAAIEPSSLTEPRSTDPPPEAGEAGDAPRAVCAGVLEARARWSPEQISGWLSETYPDHPEMWVSHETIYLSLFVQSRGALRKELTRYLRSGQATRRSRGPGPTTAARARCETW